MTILLATIITAFAAAVWWYQKNRQSLGDTQHQALVRTAADSRGITLQTLIVTAVLVLLAVAAGVVIVAITGSSSDDLEDQASDLEGAEQQHGVLTEDGRLSYSSCRTNHEVVLISAGDNAGSLTCSNVCWVAYSARGDYKALLLAGLDWGETTSQEDMDGNGNGAYRGGPAVDASGERYDSPPDGWEIDEQPIFQPATDYATDGAPVYASSQPGTNYVEPRNNGELIALGQSCISVSDVCSLSSTQRTRALAKIESSSQTSGGPPIPPDLSLQSRC